MPNKKNKPVFGIPTDYSRDGVPSSRGASVLGTLEDKDLLKYASNPYTVLPNQPNNAYMMYANQTNADRFGKMSESLMYNTLGSFITQIGITLDLEQTFNVVRGQEDEYSNVIMDFGSSLSEKGMDAIQGIKRRSTDVIDFGDPGFWMTHVAQAGTSIGMALAALTEVAITSAVTGGIGAFAKVGKVAKIGEKILETGQNLSKAQKAWKYSTAFLKSKKATALMYGGYRRNGESIMEAAEIHKILKQEFINKGYNEDTANKLAAQGAAQTYRLNMPWFAIDAVEFMTMTYNPLTKSGSSAIDKMFDAIKSPILRIVAKKTLNTVGQSLEEGYQFVGQEEGMYRGRRVAGTVERKPFSKRANDYINNPELYNSMIGGAVGSVLLGGAYSIYGKVEQAGYKKYQNKVQKEFMNKVLLGHAVTNLKDYNQAIEEDENTLQGRSSINKVAISSLVRDEVNGQTSNFEKFISTYEALEQLADETDENIIHNSLKSIGFTEENGFTAQQRLEMVKGKKETYQQIVQDAKTMKEIFDKNKKIFPTVETLWEATATEFNLGLFKEELENIKTKSTEYNNSVEGLTDVGKKELEFHSIEANIEKQIEKQKKKIETLSEDKKEKAMQYLSLLEGFYTKIVEKNQKELEKITDNRTEEQKKNDAKTILKIEKDNKYKDSVEAIASLETLISENEESLKVMKSEKYVKYKVRQQVEDYIKTATTGLEEGGELNKLVKELTEEGLMTTVFQRLIEERDNAIRFEKSQTISEQTEKEGIRIDKLNEAHNEQIQTNALREEIEEIFREFEEINENEFTSTNTSSKPAQQPTNEEVTTAIFSAQDEFEGFSESPATVTFSESAEEKNKRLVGKLLETMKKLVGENPSFEELISQIINRNIVPISHLETILANLWNGYTQIYPSTKGDSLTKAENLIKGIVTEIVSEARKNELFNKTPEEQKRITNEETKIKNQETPSVEADIDFLNNFDKEITPRFSQHQRDFNIVVVEENGKFYIRYVDVDNKIVESEIQSLTLLNPDKHKIGTAYDLRIPSDFNTRKINTHNPITGVAEETIVFGDTFKDENTEEYWDNIPIEIIDKKTGEVIATVHSVNWNGTKNLGLSSEKADNIEDTKVAEIVRRAKEETRKIRQKVRENKTKGNGTEIRIVKKSQGVFFKSDKDVSLDMAAPEDSAIVIYVEKGTGTIHGLPNGIKEIDINASALKSAKVSGGIYHIRRSLDRDNRPAYMLFTNKTDGYNNQELSDKVLKTVFTALDIYFLGNILARKDYKKALEEEGGAIAVHYMSLIDNLYDVYTKLAKRGINLTTSENLKNFIGMYFMQSNKETFKGLEDFKDIQEFLDNNYKHKTGSPFFRVIPKGIIFGFIGQELISPVSKNEVFSKNNLQRTFGNFLEIKKLFENAFRIQAEGKTSKASIPLDYGEFKNNKNILFIDPVENTIEEVNYREYLKKSVLLTNVISHKVDEENGKAVYSPFIHHVYNYALTDTIIDLPATEEINGEKEYEETILKNKTTEETKTENIAKYEELLKEEQEEQEEQEETIPEKISNEQEIINNAYEKTKFLLRVVTDNEYRSPIKGIPFKYQTDLVQFITNQLFIRLTPKNLKEVDKIKKEIRDIVQEYIFDSISTYNSIKEQLESITQTEEVERLTKDIELLISYINTLKEESNLEIIENKSLSEFKRDAKILEVENGEVQQLEADDVGNERIKNPSKSSLEVNQKLQASNRIKWFLRGVPKVDENGEVVKGFMSLPIYMSINDVFDTLHSVLNVYETDNTFPSVLETLVRKSADIPWLQNIITMLQNTDERTRIDFVGTMVKDVVKMEFVVFNYNFKEKTWHTKVWITNSNDITRKIHQDWVNTFALSPMIKDEKYDIAEINSVIEMINNLQNKKRASYNEVAQEKLLKILSERQKETLKKDGTLNFRNTDLNVSDVERVLIDNVPHILKKLPKGYFILSKASGEEDANIKSQLRSIFEKIGISLEDKTLDWVLEFGLRDTKKSYKGLEGLLGQYGILNLLKQELQKIKDSKDLSFDVDTSPNFIENITAFKHLAKTESFYTKRLLASSFRDGKKSISTYTDGKEFTQITKDLKKQTSEERLNCLKDAFSKSSLWLQELADDNSVFRQIFETNYIGLTSLLQLGKETFGNKNMHSLSDQDIAFLMLGAFQSLQKGKLSTDHAVHGIETRLSTLVSPTMSDNENVFLATTFVLKLNESNILVNQDYDFSNNLENLIFQQFVSPELDRIRDFFLINNGKTTIKGYDDGAKMFLLHPQLNHVLIDGVPIVEYLKQEKIDLTKLQEATVPVIKKIIDKQVENEIANWYKDGFIYKEKDENGKETEKTIVMFDADYFKESFSKDLSFEQKVKLAAYDFIINSQIGLMNYYQLYGGDPADYYNVSDEFAQQATPEQISEALFVNVGKRLAKLLAPGLDLVDSSLPTSDYIQLFIADDIRPSNLFGMFTKLLDNKEFTDEDKVTLLSYQTAKTKKEAKAFFNILKKKFPNSEKYLKITSTDAQEYTTVNEHLQILRQLARIDETAKVKLDKIREVEELLKRKIPYTKFSEEQKELFRFVFQPIKPVYSGKIWDDTHKKRRNIYIKSSSFPLLPWMTSGYQIDALRVKMEELEKKTGKSVRASYQTANKVGAVSTPLKIWDKDGNIIELNLNDTAIENASLVLPRKYFRLQQDVPFDENKDDISIVTQGSKILMSYISGLDGFKVFGEDMNGRELSKRYLKVMESLYDYNIKKLYNRLGIDIFTQRPNNVEKTFNEIGKLLQEEANERGWDNRSKDSLKLTFQVTIDFNDGEQFKQELSYESYMNLKNEKFDKLDTTVFPAEIIEKLKKVANIKDGFSIDFNVPLWMNSNSKRIESLLTAIVTNKIAKLKITGNSYVLGSETGFRYSKAIPEDIINQIIYVPGYDGSELKTTRKVEDGTIMSAQVLIPSKLKDNTGQLIDLLADERYYTKDPSGRLYLNTEMFSPDVLKQISFRIPTSSIGSLASIEVVGFLPHTEGDLIIVPKDFTVQKGLDYDIDKEYTYRYSTFQDETGKFHLLKERLKGVVPFEDKSVYETLLIKSLSDLKFVKKQLKKELSNKEISKDYSEKEVIEIQNLEKEIKEIEDEIKDIITELGDITEEEREEERLNSLFLKHNTQNLYELQSKIKNEAGFIKKIEEKILKDEFIALHHAVLEHPSPEIQRRVLGVLSIDFASKEADYFEQFDKQDKDSFTPVSHRYQLKKLTDAASSGLGVGSYSLDVTLQGLLDQQKAIGKQLSFNEPVEVEVEGKIIIQWLPKKFKIGKLESNGLLGEENALCEPKFKPEMLRSIAAILSERQNLMLDDAKEQIANRIGLNTYTITADKTMCFLGFDKWYSEKEDTWHSVSATILNQPIIKEYVALMKKANAQTNNEFIANKKQWVLEQLALKYPAPENFNSKDIIDNFTCDNLLEQFKSPKRKIQLAVLDFFLEMDLYGEKLRQIETNINIDSQGVGIGISEVIAKVNRVQQLAKETYITNSSSIIGTFIPLYNRDGKLLLTETEIEDYIRNKHYVEFENYLVKPETVPGFSVIYGLSAAKNLWSDYYPYEFPIFKQAINQIARNTSREVEGEDFEAVTNFDIQLIQEILEGFQMYHNSHANNGILKTNTDLQRKELFTDFEGNTSLGTYLYNLRKLVKTEEFKHLKTSIINNPFLNLLDVQAQKGYVAIHSMQTNNLEEDAIYNGFIELYKERLPLPDKDGKPYTTRNLVDDLMAYALLEGGVSYAVQFAKYIPVEVQKTKGFTNFMQDIHKRLKSSEAQDYIQDFVIQFFQHNPNRASKVKKEDIIKGNVLNLGIKNQAIGNMKYFYPLEGVKSDFIAVYNKNKQAKKKYELFLFNKINNRYEKISTFDSFDMHQYNANSIDSKNRKSLIEEVQQVSEQVEKYKNKETNITYDDDKIYFRRTMKDGSEKEDEWDRIKISADNPYDINSQSPTSILRKIGTNSSNDYFKLIATHLADYMESEKIDFPVLLGTSTMPTEGFHYQGVVAINNAYFSKYSAEEKERVLLHEILHGIFVPMLKDNVTSSGEWIGKDKTSPLYKLTLLYKEVAKLKNKNTDLSGSRALTEEQRKVYGLNDFYEFISEIMTNKVFQEEMNKHQYKDTKITLWDKFKNIVKSILEKVIGINFQDDSVAALAISNILEVTEVKEIKQPKSEIDKLKEKYEEKEKTVPELEVSEEKYLEKVEGINISSNDKGLGGALTNMTVKAKQKGNVKNNYPVIFRGIKYEDAEAAYQTNKDKNNLDDNSVKTLMIEVITAKLQQYPALVAEIDKRGGIEFLNQSTHEVIVYGKKKEDRWTKGLFIESLKEAYNNIKEETEISQREYTPENITFLKPNEIFVFGSNTEGRHGKGAALVAKQKFGAIQGQAKGLQGQSYGIITKNLAEGGRSKNLDGKGEYNALDYIEMQIADLVSFAYQNPNKKFYVTKIGINLAGWTEKEIGEIWNNQGVLPNNIILPKEFEKYISKENRISTIQQDTETYDFGENKEETLFNLSPVTIQKQPSKSQMEKELNVKLKKVISPKEFGRIRKQVSVFNDAMAAQGINEKYVTSEYLTPYIRPNGMKVPGEYTYTITKLFTPLDQEAKAKRWEERGKYYPRTDIANPDKSDYKNIPEVKPGEQMTINFSPVTIKEGVSELFESTPELAFIGTPEQYSQYLDIIFPDSKVKDIVYHGTTSREKFEKFKLKYGEDESFQGFYFADTKFQSQGIAGKEGRVFPVILNANPKIGEFGITATKEDINQAKSEGYNALREEDTTRGKNFNTTIVFEPEQIHILSSKQDIEGFKNYVQKDNMSPNFSIVDEKNINYQFKVVNLITPNLSKIEKLYTQLKNTDIFWNKIQKDYQIPKEQLQLLKESQGNSIEEKLIDFASKYGYSVEVNTAKERRFIPTRRATSEEDFEAVEEMNSQHYSNLTVPGGTNYTENEISTPLITPSIKGHAQFSTDKGIGWFRSDEQIIGRNEIPAEDLEEIRRMGHSGINFDDTAQKGTGKLTKTRRILEVQSDLFQKGRDKEKLVVKEEDEDRIAYLESIIDRSSSISYTEEGSPVLTKNIEKELTDLREIKNKSQNQFLQLLNKDNNWVTFFIKSIIQDSAKKGYEKVLFPKGETAAKIEGHETLANRINKFKDNIVKLNDAKLNPEKYKILEGGIDEETGKNYMYETYNVDLSEGSGSYSSSDKKDFIKGIDKQISIEEQNIQNLKSQGIEKLKPIEAFYEIKVGNILEKIYSKDKIETITDEYNNEWRKLEIDKERDFSPISFSIVDETTFNKTQENSQDIIEIAKNIELTSEELSNFEKLGLINPLC